jgi:hypothetical protein
MTVLTAIAAGPAMRTVPVQIGAGYRDAWATLAGGLLGALAFTHAEPALRPVLLSGGPGRLTVQRLTGLPFRPLALGLATALIVGLGALEQLSPWRQELGENADGVLPPAEPKPPAAEAAQATRT